MPQLDVSTFPSQIFWLVVTFAVLYVLMAKLALPRIEAAVEGRRARIEGDLDRAGRMKTEAEAVIAAYEKALADARHQAQLTMKETTDLLNAAAAERQKAAATVIAERTRVAEASIAAAKARLVGVEVDDARAGAAVDAVLKGRG
jgi:F-type H+-transporting ATPase subunit b